MVTASPSTRVSSLYGRMPFCVCLSVSQSVEKTATLMRRAPATVTGFEENDLRDNDGKLMEWGEVSSQISLHPAAAAACSHPSTITNTNTNTDTTTTNTTTTRTAATAAAAAAAAAAATTTTATATTVSFTPFTAVRCGKAIVRAAFGALKSQTLDDN